MKKLLLLLALLVLLIIAVLASCNYKPPSKAWKPLVDKAFRIEQLDCTAVAGASDPHCHLEVVGREPERYLEVSKSPFGGYRFFIANAGPGKVTDTEIGMTCQNLTENENYELSGECVMDTVPDDEKSAKDDPPHVHKKFRAWQRSVRVGDKEVLRIYFNFSHDGPGPQHNGTGHANTQ